MQTEFPTLPPLWFHAAPLAAYLLGAASTSSRSETKEPPTAGVQESSRTNRQVNPATVMVVDDDIDAREFLSWALLREGYRVVTAKNGVEALELLRSGVVPRAIVLDLVMPVMGGAEFLQARPASMTSIPVLVLSAATDRVDLHGVPGVLAILGKPCDARVLTRLVKVAVRSD